MASSVLTIPNQKVIDKLANRFEEVDPSAVSVVHTFVHTATALSADLEAFFDRFDLSTGRFSVLMVLYRDLSKELKQVEIAEILNVKPATMTGLIDGLEKQGYVKRLQHDTDRRGVVIKITPNAVKFLEKLLPDYFMRMSDLVKGVSNADRSRFRDNLDKIRARVGAMSAKKSGK